jgi:hypothetical protein
MGQIDEWGKFEKDKLSILQFLKEAFIIEKIEDTDAEKFAQ